MYILLFTNYIIITVIHIYIYIYTHMFVSVCLFVLYFRFFCWGLQAVVLHVDLLCQDAEVRQASRGGANSVQFSNRNQYIHLSIYLSIYLSLSPSIIYIIYIYIYVYIYIYIYIYGSQ